MILKGETMGLFKWADKKIKAQTIWDVGMLKVFCCLVGMILGAYLSVFVFRFMGWFLAVSVLLFIILIVRFFASKAKK